METLKKNKILVGVGIVVTIFFAYYFLAPSSSTPSATSPTDGSVAGSGAQIATGDTISILFQKLSSASIDTALFSSPAWTSLTDISVPIPNDPSGKADLFAPIGQGGIFVAPSTASTTVTTTTVSPTKKI